MEDAGGVDGEGVRPVGVGEFDDRSGAQDAGDVHERGDGAELTLDQLDCLVDTLGISDIQHVRSDARHLRRQGLQAPGLAVHRRDDGPLGRQHPDHGRTDALPGTGHHRDGTGEFGLLLHRTSPPTSKIRQA